MRAKIDFKNILKERNVETKFIEVLTYLSHLEFLDSRLPFSKNIKVIFKWKHDINPNYIEQVDLITYEICCLNYNCGMIMLSLGIDLLNQYEANVTNDLDKVKDSFKHAMWYFERASH
jgi:hypothetical protein